MRHLLFLVACLVAAAAGTARADTPWYSNVDAQQHVVNNQGPPVQAGNSLRLGDLPSSSCGLWNTHTSSPLFRCVVVQAAGATTGGADFQGPGAYITALHGGATATGPGDAATVLHLDAGGGAVQGALPLANLTPGTVGQAMITAAGPVASWGQVGTAGVANAAITYAKIQNESPGTLIGNAGASPAAPGEITVGAGLNLSALGVLTAAGTTPSGTGLASLVAGVWGTPRALVSPHGTIAIGNGDGSAGNPTFDLPFVAPAQTYGGSGLASCSTDDYGRLQSCRPQTYVTPTTPVGFEGDVIGSGPAVGPITLTLNPNGATAGQAWIFNAGRWAPGNVTATGPPNTAAYFNGSGALAGAVDQVTNVAALEALSGSSYRDGARVRVTDINDDFFLSLSSALTVDHLSVAAVSGLSGARWIRREGGRRANWSTSYWVDAAGGNDENTGTTSGAPLKTAAELARRLKDADVGTSITVNVVSDMADTDLLTFDFSPFGGRPAVIIQGSPRVVATGTIASAVAPTYTATNGLNQITITGFNWAPHVGRIIRLQGTSGDAGTYAVVVKDQGSGSALLSVRTVNLNPTATGFTATQVVEVLDYPKVSGIVVSGARPSTAVVSEIKLVNGSASVQMTHPSPSSSATLTRVYVDASGNGFAGLAFGTTSLLESVLRNGTFTASNVSAFSGTALVNAALSASTSQVVTSTWSDTIVYSSSVVTSDYMNVILTTRLSPAVGVGIYGLPANSIGFTVGNSAVADTECIFGGNNDPASYIISLGRTTRYVSSNPGVISEISSGGFLLGSLNQTTAAVSLGNGGTATSAAYVSGLSSLNNLDGGRGPAVASATALFPPGLPQFRDWQVTGSTTIQSLSMAFKSNAATSLTVGTTVDLLIRDGLTFTNWTGFGVTFGTAPLALADGADETMPAGSRIRFELDATTQYIWREVWRSTVDGVALTGSIFSPTLVGATANTMPYFNGSAVLSASTSAWSVDPVNIRWGSRVSSGLPIAQLQLVDQSAAADRGLLLGSHQATAAAGQQIVMDRSRGTYAAPAAVTTSDYFGRLLWQPYTGSQYLPTAVLGAHADPSGTVTTTSVPTTWWLTSDRQGGAAVTDPFAANSTVALSGSGNVVRVALPISYPLGLNALGVGGAIAQYATQTTSLNSTGVNALVGSRGTLLAPSPNVSGDLVWTKRYYATDSTTTQVPVFHEDVFANTIGSGTIGGTWSINPSINGSLGNVAALHVQTTYDVSAGKLDGQATGDTGGFFWLPQMPGAPTGTPVTPTIEYSTPSIAPIVLDTTDKRLYVYPSAAAAWQPWAQFTGGMATGYVKSATTTGLWSTTATIPWSDISGTATGVTAGSYSNATFTVGADGRITTATSGGGGGTITAVNGTAGQINATTAGSTVTLSLPNVVTAGSCTFCSASIDATGRWSAYSSASFPGGVLEGSGGALTSFSAGNHQAIFGTSGGLLTSDPHFQFNGVGFGLTSDYELQIYNDGAGVSDFAGLRFSTTSTFASNNFTLGMTGAHWSSGLDPNDGLVEVNAGSSAKLLISNYGDGSIMFLHGSGRTMAMQIASGTGAVTIATLGTAITKAVGGQLADASGADIAAALGGFPAAGQVAIGAGASVPPVGHANLTWDNVNNVMKVGDGTTTTYLVSIASATVPGGLQVWKTATPATAIAFSNGLTGTSAPDDDAHVGFYAGTWVDKDIFLHTGGLLLKSGTTPATPTGSDVVLWDDGTNLVSKNSTGTSRYMVQNVDCATVLHAEIGTITNGVAGCKIPSSLQDGSSVQYTTAGTWSDGQVLGISGSSIVGGGSPLSWVFAYGAGSYGINLPSGGLGHAPDFWLRPMSYTVSAGEEFAAFGQAWEYDVGDTYGHVDLNVYAYSCGITVTSGAQDNLVFNVTKNGVRTSVLVTVSCPNTIQSNTDYVSTGSVSFSPGDRAGVEVYDTNTGVYSTGALRATTTVRIRP